MSTVPPPASINIYLSPSSKPLNLGLSQFTLASSVGSSVGFHMMLCDRFDKFLKWCFCMANDAQSGSYTITHWFNIFSLTNPAFMIQVHILSFAASLQIAGTVSNHWISSSWMGFLVMFFGMYSLANACN
eukprot:425147_1